MSIWNSLLISLASVILFPFSALQAQVDSHLEILDLQAEDIPVQPANALLWEVSYPDGAPVSYIFGIMYKVPAKDFFLPDGLAEMVSGAEKIVMEVNPLDQNLDHLHRGTTPIDSTLEALLPRKTYQNLRTYVRDSLSDVAHYKMESRYSPILLARQFMCDYCLGFESGQEPVTYEVHLARELGLPLKLLQTSWARTAWLDRYSIAEQTNILMSSLEKREAQCEVYQAMIRAYRRQNLDQVWLLAKDAPDLGDNANMFIEARNQSWMESLVWSLKLESLFVAVNAIQLSGEFGLLHLLRKAGFQVKPVYLPVPISQD